jgi:hypothetical protein
MFRALVPCARDLPPRRVKPGALDATIARSEPERAKHPSAVAGARVGVAS